jgi:hypothetical protein
MFTSRVIARQRSSGHGRQEVADGGGDLGRVRLEGEVAGVEEPDVGARDVALEGFGSGRKEEGVIAAPDGKQRRLAGPEVLLEVGIVLNVAGIVQEQVQLDLVGTGRAR